MSKELLNRLVFIFSLLGLAVASFLFYEYNIASGSIICPTGNGCEIVRASPYSSFLGVSIPFLGIIYYLMMAIFSVIHSYKSSARFLNLIKLLFSIAAVSFGLYLTYLEAFVIRAFCFWCVISFIISLIVLLLTTVDYKKYENRD